MGAVKMYNLSTMDNANNIYQVFTGMNEMSNGLIAIFVLTAFFLVLMVVFKRTEEDTPKVVMFSSFITTIGAILLMTVGLVSWSIVVIPLIIFIGSLIAMKFTNE